MKKIISVIKYLALYYVSLTLILFAVSKFFGAQFSATNFVQYIPLGELSNRQLAWAFFGRSYNYNLFLGIIEFIAGSLILFHRTRLAGLLLALGIYTNIVLIDFEFEVNDAVQHATIEFIIVLIWLLPYLKDLKKYFWDMSGRLVKNETNEKKRLTIYLPIVFIILSSAYSLYLHRTRFTAPDNILGAYKISGLTINGEQLKPGPGKYTRDPMLFFEYRNAFILSVNGSSYAGSYQIKTDSIFISFDHEFNNIKSLRAIIRNDAGIIRGLTDNTKSFEIHIEKTKG